MFLIDIYSSFLFYENLILIDLIILHCLELIKSQLEHKAFLLVVINVAPSFPTAVETQFADQVKIRLTSQLIKGISRVLKKLAKYFNGTIISISLVPLSSTLTCYFFFKIKRISNVSRIKSNNNTIIITTSLSLQ